MVEEQSVALGHVASATGDLHLGETAIHEEFRSRDVAAVVGGEKHSGLGDLLRRGA